MASLLKNRLKTDVWKKSYLLEFYDGKIVSDCFTFSLPPENEEIKYTFRKTETKTFGGLHIDDYGIDPARITLSGTTGNTEIKKIYRPGKSDKWLTGEEEIFHLEKLLRESKKNKKNIENKMMLYDLSKIEYLPHTGDVSRRATQSFWQVFISDFSIRRSKDKPFFYNYTIEFTAIEPEEITGKKYPVFGNYDVNAALNAINETVAGIEQAMSWKDEIADKVQDVKARVDACKEAYTTVIDAVTNAVVSTTETFTAVGSDLTSVFDSFVSIAAAPLEIGLKFEQTAFEVYKTTTGLVAGVREVISQDNFLPPEILEQYQVTTEEFIDATNILLDKAENTAAGVAATAKSNVPEVISI